jgi:hypothetical protein
MFADELHGQCIEQRETSALPRAETTLMAEISLTLSGVGIRDILSGLGFPAPRWRIVAHAQHWGATDGFISELMQLPIRDYRDLGDVATTLDDRRRTRLRWTYAPPRPRRPMP